MPIERVATLIAVIGVLASSAGQAQPCPELSQPSLWPYHLGVMRHAGTAGPPQINEAVQALSKGNREEAVRLLTVASRQPIDLRIQPPEYALAIMDAGSVAWLLGACSKSVKSFRPNVVPGSDDAIRVR